MVNKVLPKSAVGCRTSTSYSTCFEERKPRANTSTSYGAAFSQISWFSETILVHPSKYVETGYLEPDSKKSSPFAQQGRDDSHLPTVRTVKALNEDVLDVIFCFLSPADLASAASTCRVWTYPSQRRLYTTLAFSDNEKQLRFVELARTLSESDRIRNLIRTLDIKFIGRESSAQAHYRWMLLLQPDTVHTMTIYDICILPHSDFIATVVGCPVLASVRHLVLRGTLFTDTAHDMDGNIVFHEGARLEDFICLPSLTSLCIAAESVILRTSTSNFARLKRLSVSTIRYAPSIHPIVQELRASLIRFDIKIYNWDRDTVSMLADDVAALTRLRHFAVFKQPDVQFSTIDIPFMDEVVEGLAGLETLYCCRDSFTSRLISRIPGSVWSVRLESWDSCAQYITPACARRQTGESNLRVLKIGSHDHRRPSKQPSPELTRQCESAGILLEALEYKYWLEVLR